ncbi:MAG: RNA 2',3'-cyclic phosphodiesterase [Methanocalculus sp.]|uniref:RNA 2',3'-cyclic phosphodiesterase n=1 Tax=Methanocalculus sp. TaxID=2004547 RepID=UPI00271DC07B|nr:RNA 2',3'-cyclic phosphodiesterase [Methanocalculus sp.]MDO9539679.1 RNA 2',3'-cyclic phosphodiesterase [Methanocalculus sp.]
MVRVFVAIDLLESLREAFSEVHEPLRRTSGRLSIVKPPLLHITLKFLGEVSSDQVHSISNALSSIHIPPYDVTLAGVSADNLRHPRVIWATVEDGGKTALLAEEIDSVLAPLGFPKETRLFRPHITIARVKEYHPDIPEVIASLSSWKGGRMPVSTFVLKKSTLTPRGPIYETITEVSL